MAEFIDTSTPLQKKYKAVAPSSRVLNQRSRVGSNICPVCEIEITTEISHLTCSVCELNYCISCTKISKLLVEVLKEDSTNNFKWTCNGCKQNFPCMTGLTQQLKNIEEQSDERISNLEIKVKRIDTEINANINQKFQNLKPMIVKEIKDEIKSAFQDVRKEVYETEDQKRRMQNLIVLIPTRIRGKIWSGKKITRHFGIH